MTNSCNTQDNDKVKIILHLIGKDRLQFMQALNVKEARKVQTSMGLFEVLSEKCRGQHNETVLSLQYCKIITEQRKNAEEWMGCLRIRKMNVNIKKQIED